MLVRGGAWAGGRPLGADRKEVNRAQKNKAIGFGFACFDTNCFSCL